MVQTLLKALLGAVAGLLAWLVWEPSFPPQAFDPRGITVERWFVLTLGLLVGLSIGGLSGYLRGSRAHMFRGAVVGAVLGSIGGLFGHQIGGSLAAGVFGPGWQYSGLLAMPGRVVSMVPLGTILGAAVGLSGMSKRAVLAGAVGGALGGAFGGLVFDPIGTLLSGMIITVRGGNEIGGPSRAVFSVGLGFGVGLFTAIIDRATRQAWVRLVVGRNEGKEWLVDAPQTFLGKSETAHVPLFGDPNVMPHHAMIVRSKGRYTLVDGGSPMGTGLNGVRISQIELTSGDMIQIGSNNLQFMLRAGRGQRVLGPERFHAQPVAPAPIPGGTSGVPVSMTFPGQTMMAPGGMAPTQAFVPTSGSQPTMAQPAAQPFAPTATLVALTGPLTGQRYAVSGAMDIGREVPTVPLAFDSLVSRRHASLALQPGGVLVTDLGSKNGTLVNGQRIVSQLLRIGETLQVGSTTFRLE